MAVVVVEGASLREARVEWVVEKRRKVVAARETGWGAWGRRLRMKLRHDAQRGAYCTHVSHDQLTPMKSSRGTLAGGRAIFSTECSL